MTHFLLALLAAAVINVIPQPASVEVHEGSFRHLKCKNRIHCTVDPFCGIAPEGYRLTVTRRGVKIEASDEAGAFYARQTLKQLVQPDGSVPCVTVNDAPRFRWRGFHIDPVRHFLSVEDIKKQIDVLSEYKINTMHWHLTDDQGWRIEIKKYPRLTEVGAWRIEFDGRVDGGFYSQEEIRDVVAYAAARFVTIVPEIEMPGHGFAAICSYPELSCTGEVFPQLYTWGSPRNVFCAGSERTYEFLEDVIAEVVELFPGEYIHIGGDECNKSKWEECPVCQARIRELGLRADSLYTAEEKLQSYAVHRMEEILTRHGRKLIGWDEILQGGLSPGATVMSWRGEDGGKAAALAGHDVVMTPGSGGMYFDHFQGDPKVEPVTIGGMSTLQKVYAYDPVPAVLAENGKSHHVKGVQCNNWAEYMYSPEQREYMLYPRAFALAEIAWTQPERKDYDDFLRRCDIACQRLDTRGIRYHIPIPEQPGGSCNSLAFTDKDKQELRTTRPLKIVYTIDGSEPVASSPEYTSPLEFSDDAVVKTAAVTAYGKLGPVRTIRFRKMEPMPAMPESGIFELRARRTDGRFLSAADIPSDAVWAPVEINSIADLCKLEPYERTLPKGTRFYASEAEGCFRVPATGVYRFSSDCERVWIDGELLIDNGGTVKRYSHGDSELVLEEGLHNFRVMFIFNVTGGWISLRSRCDIQFRHRDSGDWLSIAGASARLID